MASLLRRDSASSLLGFLQRDLLTGITHSLALVGLGRTETANLGSDLPHNLLVGTLDEHFRLGRGLDADALGRIKHHRMGKAEAQAQRLALHRDAITDADQLELALVPRGHAGDHVGEQRTRRTTKHVVDAFVQADVDATVVDPDLHARQMVHGERALGALHRDAVAADDKFDTLGQGNGLLGYTRHCRTPYATWP